MRLNSILPGLMAEKLNHLSNRIKIEKGFRDRSVSLADKIWLWKNGFASGHRALLGLTRENIQSYLDPVRYQRMHPVNGMYSKLIDNKAFLPIICPYVADLYVVIENGQIRFWKGIENKDFLKELANYMVIHSCELICKPTGSSGGSGVVRLTLKDAENVIRKMIEGRQSFLINNCVEQSEFSKNIFHGSVNTLRLIVYRNMDTRRLNIAGSMQRFGTIGSQPVDNSKHGGIAALVNPNTGVMSKAMGSLGSVHSGWYSVHPDTGAQIEGVTIPHWDERIAQILGFLETLTWLEFAGLDIVLTETGFLILEINSLPGHLHVQRNNPYLADKDIRGFFISKGLKVR